MSKRTISTAFLSVILLGAMIPPTAQAAGTLPMYPNLGVGSARLGMRTSTAVAYLKRAVSLTASGRDRRYVGRTVYFYYFGRRLRNGRYPLEVYAKPISGVSRVFIFQVNSALVGSRTCATSKGIRVGSTETALRRAYGSSLRRRSGSAGWTTYTMGSTSATDFWVRYGRVQKILIRRY